MMAILGAPNSGKSSLIHVLAQKLLLEFGALLNGDVKLNNRPITPHNFSKVGAFVA
jgi:ribosome biogenesis GTPase A